MIEHAARQDVYGFFADRLKVPWSEDFRGVLHVPDYCRGKPMSMDDVAIAVGYNGFFGRTCCMHVVIQRPELLTARIIRESFEFPFHVIGCECVLGMVDSDNDAALDFDKRLGFTEFGRIPNGAVIGDLVILRMMRDECRWLRKATH